MLLAELKEKNPLAAIVVVTKQRTRWESMCHPPNVLFLCLISRSEDIDKKKLLATENYRFLILKIKSYPPNVGFASCQV